MLKKIVEAIKFAKRKEKIINSRKRRFNMGTESPAEYPVKRANDPENNNLNEITSNGNDNYISNTSKWPREICQLKCAETLIPIRDCIQNQNPTLCHCHLRRQTNSIPQVFETRLCNRECKIHNLSHPKNSHRQRRRIDENRPNEAQTGGVENVLTQQHAVPVPSERDERVRVPIKPTQFDQRTKNNFPDMYAPARQVTPASLQNMNIYFSCGYPGHARRDCQFSKAGCTRCNKIGHIEHACRSNPMKHSMINEQIKKVVQLKFRKMPQLTK